MTKFIFYIKVAVVGPYLPEDNSVIDNYKVLEEKYITDKWDVRVTGIDASPSENSAVITLKHEINTKEATTLIFKIEHDKASAREAFRKGEQVINNFLSALTISVSGNRYLFKIEAINMIPTKEFPIPFESAPSEEFFAMNYTKKSLLPEQCTFLKDIENIMKSDKLASKLLKIFGEAIQAEFRFGSTDEKSIILFYSIIELVSQNHIKSQKKDGMAQFEFVLNELNSHLVKNMDIDKKMKYFRDAVSKVRKIDQSIISENILDTARKMGFNSEGLKILKTLVEYRNKRLAHGSHDEETHAKINFVDYREVAKEFIKFYLTSKTHTDTSYLSRIQTQKEVSNWYNISYLNSTLKEKTD